MDLKELGNLLKNKRNELKLSLREASSLIGISHNYLSILEKAYDPRSKSPIKPTIDTLKLISEAYKIDINELLKLAGYENIKIVLDYKNMDKNEENDLTPEEQELLEKIKSDPELSILFHDLKSAPKKKIKQLLKTWEFVKEQFDNWEDEE